MNVACYQLVNAKHLQRTEGAEGGVSTLEETRTEAQNKSSGRHKHTEVQSQH